MRYYEQIYHSIKQMIFTGVMKPGERIYEARIAREFNVSRSPVREAVRALEKEGLLFIDEKSKIYVYKPSLEDVEDIYQCRMALESLAARLTTKLISDEELGEIEALLKETSQCIISRHLTENKAQLIELNARFHDLVMRGSKNKYLQKQLEDLRSLAYFYRVLNFQGEDREKTILSEHREIVNQMKIRDESGAAECMARHIQNDLKHLKHILEDHYS